MAPDDDDMPSTIRRSPEHAQATWSAAHASAEEQYGSGERAERTAYAALKHGFEKVGDHWEPKDEKGPSDDGAERRGAGTQGGVDANASKAHLMDLARRLDVSGRSRMTKDELVDGIRKANDRETRRARESGD
ncbi:ChaB family protein [Clavibacter sp. MX14-G9D]|uniref:ChaB family protein n=1 Tax=Clavibacter sp. MX14-G9D TaxID=3064656 RepID=UPI00293E497C|nr:ChaB family protein [Clavibacter sp. MX14-G9D]